MALAQLQQQRTYVYKTKYISLALVIIVVDESNRRRVSVDSLTVSFHKDASTASTDQSFQRRQHNELKGVQRGRPFEGRPNALTN